MPESYDGTISLPIKFTKDKKIKNALILEFGEKTVLAQIKTSLVADHKVISFTKIVCRGEFEELEDLFVDNNIPFDRHSSGFYEIQPETRYFRPETKNAKSIDVTTLETEYGGAFIHVSDLKPLLSKSPEEALKELKQMIAELDDDFVKLEDWV